MNMIMNMIMTMIMREINLSKERFSLSRIGNAFLRRRCKSQKPRAAIIQLLAMRCPGCLPDEHGMKHG